MKENYKFYTNDNLLTLITELASTSSTQYFIGEIEIYLYDINRKALKKDRATLALLERNKKKGYIKFRTIFNYPDLVGNSKIELHEKGKAKLDNMLKQNKMENVVGALMLWFEHFNKQKNN